jgi:hypothetical protein
VVNWEEFMFLGIFRLVILLITLTLYRDPRTSTILFRYKKAIHYNERVLYLLGERDTMDL